MSHVPSTVEDLFTPMPCNDGCWGNDDDNESRVSFGFVYIMNRRLAFTRIPAEWCLDVDHPDTPSLQTIRGLTMAELKAHHWYFDWNKVNGWLADIIGDMDHIDPVDGYHIISEHEMSVFNSVGNARG